MACAVMTPVDRNNYCCFRRESGNVIKCECSEHGKFDSYATCPFKDGRQAKGLCKFYNVSRISECSNSLYKITINNKVIDNEFTIDDLVKLEKLLLEFLNR